MSKKLFWIVGIPVLATVAQMQKSAWATGFEIGGKKLTVIKVVGTERRATYSDDLFLETGLDTNPNRQPFMYCNAGLNSVIYYNGQGDGFGANFDTHEECEKAKFLAEHANPECPLEFRLNLEDRRVETVVFRCNPYTIR